MDVIRQIVELHDEYNSEISLRIDYMFMWLCQLDDDLWNCLFFLSISQDDYEDEDMISAIRSIRPGLGET